MKPKSLKAPFQFESRHLLLQDKILYIPDYLNEAYQHFHLSPWDDPELFGRNAPLKVEVCSGNGHWLCDKAFQFPQYNWIGIEKRFDRIQKIWSKIQNRGLTNVFLVCGTAERMFTYYLKPQSISEIFINFPDPWPKDRHAKHRIMKPNFAADCSTALDVGARLHTMSDDLFTIQSAVELFQSAGLVPHFKDPHFMACDVDASYGSSWFATLWKSLHRTALLASFEKQ